VQLLAVQSADFAGITAGKFPLAGRNNFLGLGYSVGRNREPVRVQWAIGAALILRLGVDSTTKPYFADCARRRTRDYPIGQSERLAMRTTILAYVIALAGLVMIVAGARVLFILVTEEMFQFPLSDYAIAVGLISGGLGLVGIAQALRILLAISSKG
jgi:hypothetical protein